MKLLTKKNNFLFLTILVFVFVASTALVVSGQIPKIIEALPVQASKSFPQVPVLGVESSFPTFSAQGVMAVDLVSGISLYEKNTDNPLLPASTTKIVTALVALDTYSLDTVLTVGRVKVEGQKMGLFTGEKMRVEDLLYGLLVYSANDAAEVLAQNFPKSSIDEAGGYGVFVKAMNIKAKELSMHNSHFENPVGLDGYNQVTTAKDLIRVSEVAMRNPVFARIVGTKTIVVKDISGTNSHYLKNINQLLGVVPGVLGVKTGWTENARENLVTYMERDGHKIMLVVLGSQDRFGETKELIDWIFTNYTWEDVVIPQPTPRSNFQ